MYEYGNDITASTPPIVKSELPSPFFNPIPSIPCLNTPLTFNTILLPNSSIVYPPGLNVKSTSFIS